MVIPPIGAPPPSPVTPAGGPTAPSAAPGEPGGTGFADAVARGLEQVSGAEKNADAAALDVATGGDTGVHELMAATAQASLSVDLLVQVRNRAIEAYQEIMRIQV